MKVTFYGSIALAAIAADRVNATFTYDEDEFESLPQLTSGIEIREAEKSQNYAQELNENEA